MNIAIVSAGLSTRSGLRAPIELALALRARGHRVSFYAPSANADPAARQLLESSNITLQTIGSQGRLRQIREVVTKLKAEKPDLISAHCFFLQLLAARLAGPPLIWTYYGTQLDAIKEHYFPRIPFWVKLLNPLGNLFTRAKTRLMVLLADEIIPISTAAARDLERLYGVKPATTIPLGATPQTFVQKPNIRSPIPKPYPLKPISLLSVSRLTPYKGFHTLIQVVNELAKGIPNLKLTIAGSAPLPKYLRYLRSIASDNIVFRLNVSDTQLLKLYEQADVYLTADRFLYFGLPIWEAASLGVPTVAMRYKSAPEAVIHGKTGYLAEDETQMQKYLKRLLANAKLRRKLGNEARKHAARHGWSKCAVSYASAFRKTLRKTYSPLLSDLLRGKLEALTSKPGLRLADLGTGDAMNLRILDKLGYLEKFNRIVALDRSKSSLGNLHQKYPQLRSIRGDITDMASLPVNHFDLILLTQVIEHIKDQKQALREIHRLLKPGGRLFISSVAKRWYGLYWHRNREGKIAVHPDHVHEFDSLTEISDLLTTSGLKIIEAHAIPGRIPLFDYLVRFQRVLAGKPSTAEHRDIYLTHPRFIRWHRRLSFLPLPGYSIVEALAERPKQEKV